ncbi:MAG: hypothetical protein IPL32_09860 [Chloracidobacterium sp.]|nr:hypothetical protein [Chloracidobacterium sp.]
METALDKLKRITAWDAEPTLSEDDLDAILAVAALVDIDGLVPSDEEWKPTYDLNAAAASAWLVKAARASTLTEVDPPESGIFTSKVFDNCRAMARIYAAKRNASMSLNTG